MKLIRRISVPVLLTLFFFCLPGLIYSQSENCPDIGGVDPDYPCPIDSWLIVLLVAGVLYGVWKAYQSKKESEISSQS
jgi:hypothetical protein